MEIPIIAGQVLAALAPYLAKAGAKVAEKVGEQAFEAVKNLYTLIKSKFSDDQDAADALQRLEAKPDSASNKAALKGVLEDKMNADSAFAEAVRERLAAVKAAGVETTRNTVTVSGHGKTGDIVQIGHLEGNVDLSKRPK